jgi:hypothetical protein
MRNVAACICLIGLLAAPSLGCISHEGQLGVFLTTSSTTDAAIAAQQVNLEITSLEVWDNDKNVFVNLSTGSQVYELIGLEGRQSLLALATELEQGSYSQVRLSFSESNSSIVTAAGRRNPLSIEPTTLTVPVAFRVVEDTESGVLMDIDLPASLTLKGNGTWVLRPVMRQVLDPVNLPR